MQGTPPPVRYALNELLEVIPVLTHLEPYRDLNLNSWRKAGAFRLVSSSKQGFDLEANHREFAAAILADSQHLLNQVLEHRAHLLQAVSTASEPSPTWLFVTLYYLGLYAAMAWTRTTNSSVIYLDKEAIAEFCGPATAKPGGGSFYVRLIQAPLPAAANPTIEVRKGPSHFHEAVWTRAALEATKAKSWIEAQSASRPPTKDELISLRALDLLARPAFGSVLWPSKLRNALNYRPGFSYRGVLRNNILRLRSRLNKQPLRTLTEVVEFGERAKLSIGAEKDPARMPNEAAELFIALSLLLEYYSSETLRGVCDLQGLTSSAPKQRTAFTRQFCGEMSATVLRPF